MPRPAPIEIQNRFKNLPQDLKAAILDVDTANIIEALEKKYHLTVEQAGNLADEVGLFMLGFTKPENFSDSIQNRLRMNLETVRGIIEDLNLQIFSKVRDSLKRAHTLEENPVIPIPKAPPVAAAPITTPAPAQPQKGVPQGESLGIRQGLPLKDSPFESKLQEKVFSAQKELSEAREQKIYPGNKDPYREPTS
ncbi:MAG: hypothetical protein HYS44_02240 [Candidatus Niyogibacteria bacterium]|nr:hypothetical protein [Candidatus Niyogibacteria bacterium]